MEVTLRSEVIKKLSARGILAYVAMSMARNGKEATRKELAQTLGIDESLLVLRQEDSYLLQNLDFAKKPRTRKPPKPFVLPDWIPAETWSGFVEARRRKHGAPTVHGSHLLVKELEKLRQEGHDPVAVLNQSAIAGYAGVFPIRQSNTNGFHAQPAPVLRPTEFKR